MGNVPANVTTTYVSVSELEGTATEGATTEGTATEGAATEGTGSRYTRLSDGSEGDLIIDPNLLIMDDKQHTSSESSEDELNSSDEDRYVQTVPFLYLYNYVNTQTVECSKLPVHTF